MAKGTGSGFKIVNGYKFPEDATDEEIAKALSLLQDPNAPKLSETPEAQRPQTLQLKDIMGPTLGETSFELPSKASMAEIIPGAAGAGGAMLAGPPGAAVGAGAGEIARQVIRKYLGLAPATGNIQKLTGMDPTGLPASVTGTVAEAATAGTGEALISKLAASGLPTYLREKALNVFSGMFPVDEAAREAMKNSIRPIAEELPVGTRRQLQRAAAAGAKKSGDVVGDIYNVDIPASFQPVVDRLRDLSTGQVRRQAGFKDTIDPVTGVMKQVETEASIKNPKLMREYSKRMEEMAIAEEAALGTSNPNKIRDLYEARLAADEMMNAEKSIKAGGSSRYMTPKERALFEERQALKRELHDPVTWSGGKAPQAVSPVGPQQPPVPGPQLPVKGQITPEGEAAAQAAADADLAHKAWKTLEKGTKGEAQSFLARWFAGRTIPGVAGTAAGVVAGKPAFWRSLTSKQMMQMAKAIEAGDEAVAFRILNAAVNDYEGANKVQ